MRPKTWRIIAAIARNARRELLSRGAPTIFVVMLTVTLYLFRATDVRLAKTYLSFLDTMDGALAIAAQYAFLLGLNLYGTERGRRTLMLVMAHPVDAWMHLAGRLLGLLTWYLGFAALTLLCTTLRCYDCARNVMDMDLLGVMLQGTLRGVAWITLGVTLGALFSQWRALALVASLIVANLYFSKVGENAPGYALALRHLFHFLAPVGPDPAKPLPSLGTFDALQSLENMLYAATVFIVGTALLERRDVPTRGA